MLSNWSYRKKNIYFIVSCLLLLIIAYQLAIRKSLDLIQENSHLKQSNESFSELQVRLGSLTRQKQLLDSILETRALDNEKEFLLKRLSAVNHRGTQLARYSEVTQRSTAKRFSVFRYEGSFSNLGRLLHQVESRGLGGSVSSVKFEVETDRRTKISRLFMEMYFAK